jgi:hypothetical protein
LGAGLGAGAMYGKERSDDRREQEIVDQMLNKTKMGAN